MSFSEFKYTKPPAGTAVGRVEAEVRRQRQEQAVLSRLALSVHVFCKQAEFRGRRDRDS